MWESFVHHWKASAITPTEWRGIFTFWGLGLAWAVITGLWGRWRRERAINKLGLTPRQIKQQLRDRQRGRQG